MRYVGFEISNYKGIIKTNVQIREGLTPFIGVNESGKSTVLEAIASFDKANDSLYEGHFINNELIKCKFNRRKSPKIIAEIYLDKSETENFIKKLFKYLFEEYSQLARMIRTERNRDDGTIGYSIINDSELAEIQESLLELIDNLTVKQKSYKFLIQREFGPEGGKYTLLDKNDIIDDSFCINKDKRINLQGGNQIVEILSENGQKYYLDKTVLSKDEFVINYILDLLPPVIYIDDFKDIIPDRITDSNNEQYIRLKNIACNLIAMEITEDEFDDIDQLESADRLTLLNQISRVINDNIGEVWNKNHVFKSPSKDDLFHIAVQLKYENGAFEFLIVDLDNADKTQNTYKFSQRSKGFKWYFNYLFENFTFTVPVFEDVNNCFFLFELFVKFDSSSLNSAIILPSVVLRIIELFAVRLLKIILPVVVFKLILSELSLGRLLTLIFPSSLVILISFIVDDDKSISPVSLSTLISFKSLILFNLTSPVATLIFRELFLLFKLSIFKFPVANLISASKAEILVIYTSPSLLLIIRDLISRFLIK